MAALFQIPQSHGNRRDSDDPPSGGAGGGRSGALGGLFGRSASFLPEFAVGLRPLPSSMGEPEGEDSADPGFARVGLGQGASRSPLRPEYAQPGLSLRPAWFVK
jgi:hypothetical protein